MTEEEYVEKAVREAWANAKANDYEPDPSNLQEAVQLSDYCPDIEEWIWRLGDADFDRRFNILKHTVAKLRAEKDKPTTPAR